MTQLADKRKELGHTQEEMAVLMEVSRRHIARMESGESPQVSINKYNSFLEKLLTQKRADDLNRKIEKIGDDSVNITPDYNHKTIHVATNFKYFEIRYNIIAKKCIIGSIGTIVESIDDVVSEIERVGRIVQILNS